MYKMKSYCLDCKKDTENINPRVSKCAICGSKKSRFVNYQVTKVLSSNLGVRTPLSEVPILDYSKCMLNCLKMNEIVSKFLLPSVKYMPEMHLKQPGLTYSACGPFTKNKERI